MPHITVRFLEGRTLEQKRAFVREVTDATIRSLGVKPEAINIVFEDVAWNNWAIGGQLLGDRTPAEKRASLIDGSAYKPREAR